jgi:Dinucleotide-utilizing enzymes involved in molybdopterin and thiamine biosynthesis family 2
VAAKLNLDYAYALKLMVADVKQIGLTLVGCGGTGSWLAPAVVRIGKLLTERWQKEVTITFVDPDQVEEQNCYRQNFSQAEIGRNKAETLAMRYGNAWGVEIRTEAGCFEAISHQELNVVIGCVDNTPARRSISEVIEDHASWWLDSGNSKSSGQVLLGRGFDLCTSRRQTKEEVFAFEGFCTWLPTPALQHPELVENTRLEDLQVGDEGLSCAEMAVRNSQGLTINQRMAAEAADYLTRMLITKDLKRYATYIDLESGSTQSKYATRKEISKWLTVRANSCV